MYNIGDTYNPWRVFRGRGSRIPNSIMRNEDLSPTAKLIFARLAQYAGENGEAFPSFATLGKEVGVKKRQAKRIVDELIDYGLIRAITRNRPDGGQSSNAYIFLRHVIFTAEDLTPSATDDTGGSAVGDTPGAPKMHLPPVPPMAPKNKKTITHKTNTTNHDFASLLSLADKTPFGEINESTFEALANRHGHDHVAQTIDIAAETWRRKPTEIANPSGYLTSLCKSLVIPEWYIPPDTRAQKAAEAAQHRITACQTKAAEEAALERLAAAKKIHWEGLDSDEQERYRKLAKEKMPPGIISTMLVSIMAVEAAWEAKPQASPHDAQLSGAIIPKQALIIS